MLLREILFKLITKYFSLLQSERLPVALYNGKWYEENEEYKFITRMMLMRTNRTIAMQVGGFTTMSLVTLLGVSIYNNNWKENFYKF